MKIQQLVLKLRLKSIPNSQFLHWDTIFAALCGASSISPWRRLYLIRHNGFSFATVLCTNSEVASTNFSMHLHGKKHWYLPDVLKMKFHTFPLPFFPAIFTFFLLCSSTQHKYSYRLLANLLDNPTKHPKCYFQTPLRILPQFLFLWFPLLTQQLSHPGCCFSPFQGRSHHLKKIKQTKQKNNSKIVIDMLELYNWVHLLAVIWRFYQQMWLTTVKEKNCIITTENNIRMIIAYPWNPRKKPFTHLYYQMFKVNKIIFACYFLAKCNTRQGRQAESPNMFNHRVVINKV